MMLENPTHALVGVHAHQENSDNLKPNKNSSWAEVITSWPSPNYSRMQETAGGLTNKVL